MPNANSYFSSNVKGQICKHHNINCLRHLVATFETLKTKQNKAKQNKQSKTSMTEENHKT